MSDKANRYPFMSVDRTTVLLYILLLAFGWVTLCGASHEIGDTDFLSWESRTGKQLAWMCCSFGLGFTLLMIDDRYFDTLAGLLYVGTMLLLLVTPFIASDIKGSYSWIKLGPLSLQPAEFAKCVTALTVSKYISQYGFSLHNMKHFAQAACLILLPMVLIIMQRETGSALVYFAFFLMFYREGMPGCFLFTAAAAVTYFVVGIRFSDTLLPGTMTSVGEFSVMLLIWLFTLGMVRVYCPQSRHTMRLLLWGGAATLLALLVSTLIYPFDIGWVQLAVCIGMAGYLSWQSLGERINK